MKASDASKIRVLNATDPNGHDTSGTFDAHDNRLTTTNGLGQTTTAAFNANNSLTQITSPLAGSTGTAGDLSFTYPTAVGVRC